MEILGKVLRAIILIMAIAALNAFPVKWLWNWLMPVNIRIAKNIIMSSIGVVCIMWFVIL